jgi:hypothetical protein
MVVTRETTLTVDRRGKRAAAAVEESPSRGAVPAVATKKRKLVTAAEVLGVSDHFAVDLMGTCAAPGGRMSSLELRESSARMLEVTGGRWPRNVPIPLAAGEDIFMSRLAREMKIFPYGQNIFFVVLAVMDKDRQDATWKRRAFTRVGDPSREVKKARGISMSAAPGSSKPPPAAKPAIPGPSRPSSGVKAIAPSSSKPPSAEPTQERVLPSPLCTIEAVAGGAELSMDICVDDYRVGGVMMFDAHTGRGLVCEFILFYYIYIYCFFHRVWVLDKTVMQGRMLGNWMLSRRRWRPRRSRQQPRQRVLRRTHGSSFAPTARLLRLSPLKTWRAQLRSS